MFLGYYRDPELTGRAWHDGIYHTGDVAWRDEDGYLWFVGRTDDVIKSSGYRIGPFEVESALIEHPAVLECAVTGVADPDRIQVVKATVVLAKGYTPSPELSTELQEHVKKTTAPYKYPRIIEFVDRASQDDQRKDPAGGDPGARRGVAMCARGAPRGVGFMPFHSVGETGGRGCPALHQAPGRLPILGGAGRRFVSGLQGARGPDSSASNRLPVAAARHLQNNPSLSLKTAIRAR